MDYLPELCQLSNTFDNPQLDSILVEYIIEHLPLVIDNIFLLDLLPNRLLTLLNKTIAGNFHKCRTAHTVGVFSVNISTFLSFKVSQTRSELQYRFLRLANEYLATLDDMSPSEFLQFIKKRPRASHKVCSLWDNEERLYF